MKRLELLREEIFLVKNKPWIRNFFDDSVVEIRDDELGYALSLDVGGDVKPIKLSLISGDFSEKIGSKNTFVNHIKEYKPANFRETLFLLDIYDYSREIHFEQAIKNFKRLNSYTYEVINSILADSEGIILWHYQLENILNIFFNNSNEVISIRKDINAKKSATFKILRKYKIDNTVTLEDFICGRMILSNVIRPNIYGASVLYDLLRK